MFLFSNEIYRWELIITDFVLFRPILKSWISSLTVSFTLTVGIFSFKLNIETIFHYLGTKSPCLSHLQLQLLNGMHCRSKFCTPQHFIVWTYVGLGKKTALFTTYFLHLCVSLWVTMHLCGCLCISMGAYVCLCVSVGVYVTQCISLCYLVFSLRLFVAFVCLLCAMRKCWSRFPRIGEIDSIFKKIYWDIYFILKTNKSAIFFNC